jgi:hypothetical protein
MMGPPQALGRPKEAVVVWQCCSQVAEVQEVGVQPTVWILLERLRAPVWRQGEPAGKPEVGLGACAAKAVLYPTGPAMVAVASIAPSPAVVVA